MKQNYRFKKRDTKFERGDQGEKTGAVRFVSLLEFEQRDDRPQNRRTI
jgi:hypothetical protein